MIYGLIFIMTLEYHVQGVNDEAIYAVLLQIISIYIVSYILLHQSKMLFVTKKYLERVMDEQQNIVRNLPDGIMVTKSK